MGHFVLFSDPIWWLAGHICSIYDVIRAIYGFYIAFILLLNMDRMSYMRFRCWHYCICPWVTFKGQFNVPYFQWAASQKPSKMTTTWLILLMDRKSYYEVSFGTFLVVLV